MTLNGKDVTLDRRLNTCLKLVGVARVMGAVGVVKVVRVGGRGGIGGVQGVGGVLAVAKGSRFKEGRCADDV